MTNEWIKCSDKLPPDLLDVLFFYVIKDNFFNPNSIVKKDIVCGHLEKGIWHICYLYHTVPLKNLITVTHWMELPEYPIKEWDMNDELKNEKEI